MGCPTSIIFGDNLVFSVTTHDAATGILTDADANPIYRIYEDETGVPILTGTMAKLDDPGTTGFYTEQIACTTGNGFELHKTYSIYIEATVLGAVGGMSYGFSFWPDVSILIAAATKTSVFGDEFEISAGDFWEIFFTNLGDITGRLKLWFTIKRSKAHTDAQSLVKIEETLGLEQINGTAATVPANGSITVTDAVAGNITVRLEGQETVKLIEAESKNYYDVKWVTAAGREVTLLRSRMLIISDVTRETVI